MAGEDRSGKLWVDADLERRHIGHVIDRAADLCHSFQPGGFGIETNAWQDLLADPFQSKFNEHGLAQISIYGIPNTVAKTIHIRRLDTLLRAKCTRFRNTPGGGLLVNQLMEFPAGPPRRRVRCA